MGLFSLNSVHVSGGMTDLYIYANSSGLPFITNDIASFWSPDLETVCIYGLRNIPLDLKTNTIIAFLEGMIQLGKNLVGWCISDSCDTFYFCHMEGSDHVFPTLLPILDADDINSYFESF